MHFYLKTWFIILLIITASGVFLSVLYLSEITTRLEFLAAQNIFSKTERDAEIKTYGLKDGSPSTGNPKARITVVEFGDFECPFCREAFFVLKDVLPRYKDEVYFQYRHFPLDAIHKEARVSAEASMCANEQDAFWKYHDLLYERQDQFGKEPWSAFAKELGLNIELFDQCLMDGKYKQFVEEDFEDGRALGVSATPTFFINGNKIQGVLPRETWEQLIKEMR